MTSEQWYRVAEWIIVIGACALIVAFILGMRP